ncbi:MAG: hypothetical protein KC912_26890 [Proteobacteria bacterium]|nr:hypothetical protein [Pseudomonadota bacterium]
MLRPLLLTALLFSPIALAVEAPHQPVDDALTSKERVALKMALDDAHKAIATHAKVLFDYPKAKAFEKALEAEKAQAAALSTLLEAHGEEVPANRWAGRIRAPGSLLEACTTALQDELALQGHYQDLVDSGLRASLQAATAELPAASRDVRVQAFEACVEKQSKKAAKGK